LPEHQQSSSNEIYVPKHAVYDNQNDNDRNPRSLVLNLGPKPVEAQSYDGNIQTFGDLSIVNSDPRRGDNNETIQTPTKDAHTASKELQDGAGSLQEYRD